MRKAMSLLVILCLATIATPADAAKKKGSKPYVSEEVTINWSHTSTYSTTGTLVSVTAQEFLMDCSIPSVSNGVDAYVFETPKAYRGVESTIQAFGAGSPIGHDLDIYLFDDKCEEVASYASLTVDEFGEMPKGTAFILLHNFGFNPGGGGGPVQAHFEITPPMAKAF
jgi:hypothetical protein